jgi:hypothetical protein
MQTRWVDQYLLQEKEWREKLEASKEYTELRKQYIQNFVAWHYKYSLTSHPLGFILSSSMRNKIN